MISAGPIIEHPFDIFVQGVPELEAALYQALTNLKRTACRRYHPALSMNDLDATIEVMSILSQSELTRFTMNPEYTPLHKEVMQTTIQCCHTLSELAGYLCDFQLNRSIILGDATKANELSAQSKACSDPMSQPYCQTIVVAIKGLFSSIEEAFQYLPAAKEALMRDEREYFSQLGLNLYDIRKLFRFRDTTHPFFGNLFTLNMHRLSPELFQHFQAALRIGHLHLTELIKQQLGTLSYKEPHALVVTLIADAHPTRKQRRRNPNNERALTQAFEHHHSTNAPPTKVGPNHRNRTSKSRRPGK